LRRGAFLLVFATSVCDFIKPVVALNACHTDETRGAAMSYGTNGAAARAPSKRRPAAPWPSVTPAGAASAPLNRTPPGSGSCATAPAGAWGR